MARGNQILRKFQSIFLTVVMLFAVAAVSPAQDWGRRGDSCDRHERYDNGYRSNYYGDRSYRNNYSDSYYRNDRYYSDDYYRRDRPVGQSVAIVGGSAAAGAVIGGITAGGKGAGLGAVIGGVGGLIYDRSTAHRY